MEIFLHLLTVILISYGLAILFTEKKRSWPVRRIVLILKHYLKYFHRKMPKVFDCSVCTSFWTSLLTELFLLVVCYLFNLPIIFMWPFSGFATAGITWAIMDSLNTFAFIAKK